MMFHMAFARSKQLFRSSRGAAVAALLIVLASPAATFAQDEDAPRLVVDARLEGVVDSKGGTVDLTTNMGGGNALTWFVFVLLAALAASVMFKDARRSHLD